MINFKHLLIIIKNGTLGAKSVEVLYTALARAFQDLSTPSDRARRDTAPIVERHEIHRREGT